MFSLVIFAIMAAPAYDVSSWDLHPGSIPRANAVDSTPAGAPVISGGGIVTDPAQVSGTVTNVLTGSADLTTNWPPASLGVVVPVVTANQATAPDGTLTAERIDLPAISTLGHFSFIYRNAGYQNYTYSVWLRAVTGTATVWLTAANTGTYIRTKCELTTTWQRFSLNLDNSRTWFYPSVGLDYRDATQQATGSLPAQSIYAAEAQIEAVGNLSTPGPYVATAATSASGVRGEYEGQPSDPGILVQVQLSDLRTWGVGISASKASWAGADALVDIGGQLSGYRWNSARLETTAAGALVLTVIDATGASATRTVAAHEFADGSTHRLSFGALDGIPFLLVDGVDSGTLAGAAVLSSFPSVIGINSTVHPVAKTVYRVSQGPTPWSAQTRLK